MKNYAEEPRFFLLRFIKLIWFRLCIKMMMMSQRIWLEFYVFVPIFFGFTQTTGICFISKTSLLLITKVAPMVYTSKKAAMDEKKASTKFTFE
jgi:hypothetical protein